ncbi:hypothetical protein A2952_02715 [Candidatus Kaiserbacteria bacterium RIFCSPLOWO2_01_FULL_59_34]|nr:MAG: hypothetical protein A2952_02715 [Candidatus Kaiserbacteria bacterium RIFCSPLOWO2_01_FULL_59_34]OGG85689.1 MAG: hypothetical protein A3I47_00450 [Candidatus Kaiserbacteria bacterium RIFCSPLOWO2_02_FULL_59_19]
MSRRNLFHECFAKLCDQCLIFFDGDDAGLHSEKFSGKRSLAWSNFEHRFARSDTRRARERARGPLPGQKVLAKFRGSSSHVIQ